MDPHLYYFDLYGTAEVIRMILNYKGVSFVDQRLDLSDWDNLIARGFSEFDDLPVLEIDGLKMVEYNAIYRYLAKKYGLYPDSTIEAYLIDSLLEFKNEIYSEYSQYVLEKNTEQLSNFFENRVSF